MIFPFKFQAVKFNREAVRIRKVCLIEISYSSCGFSSFQSSFIIVGTRLDPSVAFAGKLCEMK